MIFCILVGLHRKEGHWRVLEGFRLFQTVCALRKLMFVVCILFIIRLVSNLDLINKIEVSICNTEIIAFYYLHLNIFLSVCLFVSANF